MVNWKFDPLATSNCPPVVVIARPLFSVVDLVDADQLRELAQVLLPLVLEGSGIAVGRGGLNLLVELRKIAGESVHLADHRGRLLVERGTLRLRLAAALETSPARVDAEESTCLAQRVIGGIALPAKKRS